MSRLGWALDARDLPVAELCAARLDGELFRLDRSFIPVDMPESPMHRAATLLPAGEHLIAERLSAAWILGATPQPPARHQFCVDHRRRVYLPGTHGLLVREVVLSDRDVRRIAGLRVTTPLRTVVDLARVSEHFDDQIRTVVKTLMLDHRICWAECESRLNANPHLPHRRRALERVAVALGRSSPPR